MVIIHIRNRLRGLKIKFYFLSRMEGGSGEAPEKLSFAYAKRGIKKRLNRLEISRNKENVKESDYRPLF